MKIKKIKTYRQGDIHLVLISKLPSNAIKDVPTSRILLGEGETAGHRHEIIDAIDKVQAYRKAEALYLSVKEETLLVHPEHEAIALLPGTYEVIRQHEYVRKEILRVQD